MIRIKWWLLMALILGCKSETNTEPNQSVADIAGRVLSKENVAVADKRVEVRCEMGRITDTDVTDSNGTYGVGMSLPGKIKTTKCNFASPAFEEPHYTATADISLYPWGVPHPMQTVDLHAQSGGEIYIKDLPQTDSIKRDK